MIRWINLTKFGEKLRAEKGAFKEEGKLSLCIGVHDICTGFVHLREVSKTYNVIQCLLCGLRIVIPAEIKTYGELRSYFRKISKKED